MTEADEKDFKTMTDVAFGLMVPDLERNGGVTPVFLLRHKDRQIEKLKFPAQFASLMNVGAAKDVIFKFIRDSIPKRGITAVCFGTEAWRGRQTAAGLLVAHEEFMAACRSTGFQVALDKGWVVREEVLIVTIQSKDVARTINRPFERNDETRTVILGEIESHDIPQAHFNGRFKMFGDMRPENLS